MAGLFPAINDGAGNRTDTPAGRLAQFDDPDRQGRAIEAIQPTKRLASPPLPGQEHWLALAARPAVRAAFDRHARPLPNRFIVRAAARQGD